ncbi:hypothetical protein ASD60_09450 [Pseudomonas sp. Root562]|nr:hypothetical protein ASD60_09450 [Pseudomonas sp. Root562]
MSTHWPGFGRSKAGLDGRADQALVSSGIKGGKWRSKDRSLRPFLQEQMVFTLQELPKAAIF